MRHLYQVVWAIEGHNVITSAEISFCLINNMASWQSDDHSHFVFFFKRQFIGANRDARFGINFP